MSGGSYEYLFCKDATDMFSCRDDLRKMVERLSEEDASDAAEETESILLILNQFENRLNARIGRLSGVWKAIEWIDSGDGADLTAALDKYRKG